MGVLQSLTILATFVTTVVPSSSAQFSQNSSVLTSFKPVVEKVDPYASPVPKPEEKKALVIAYVPSQTPPPVAPTSTPAPQTSPAPQSTPMVLSDSQITFLGNCESGMTATRNSGNGYYGAFQFSYGTWQSMGTGYERADLAPIEVQKDAVQRLVARSSVFTQFPGCSAQMRAQGLL